MIKNDFFLNLSKFSMNIYYYIIKSIVTDFIYNYANQNKQLNFYYVLWYNTINPVGNIDFLNIMFNNIFVLRIINNHANTNYTHIFCR